MWLLSRRSKGEDLHPSQQHSYKTQAVVESHIQILLEPGQDTTLLTKVTMLAPLLIHFYPMTTERFMLPCRELDQRLQYGFNEAVPGEKMCFPPTGYRRITRAPLSRNAGLHFRKNHGPFLVSFTSYTLHPQEHLKPFSRMDLQLIQYYFQLESQCPRSTFETSEASRDNRKRLLWFAPVLAHLCLHCCEQVSEPI